MTKKTTAELLPANVMQDPWLGEAVFIRTVTHFYTGRLIAVDPHNFWLNQVTWVANTGRFYVWLSRGANEGSELHPWPDGSVVRVPRPGAEISLWPHDLPRQPVERSNR